MHFGQCLLIMNFGHTPAGCLSASAPVGLTRPPEFISEFYQWLAAENSAHWVVNERPVMTQMKTLPQPSSAFASYMDQLLSSRAKERFLLFFSEMLSKFKFLSPVCLWYLRAPAKTLQVCETALKSQFWPLTQIREVHSEVQPIPSNPHIARILNPRIEDPRSLAVYDIRGASCISDAVL